MQINTTDAAKLQKKKQLILIKPSNIQLPTTCQSFESYKNRCCWTAEQTSNYSSECRDMDQISPKKYQKDPIKYPENGYRIPVPKNGIVRHRQLPVLNNHHIPKDIINSSNVTTENYKTEKKFHDEFSEAKSSNGYRIMPSKLESDIVNGQDKTTVLGNCVNSLNVETYYKCSSNRCMSAPKAEHVSSPRNITFLNSPHRRVSTENMCDLSYKESKEIAVSNGFGKLDKSADKNSSQLSNGLNPHFHRTNEQINNLETVKRILFDRTQNVKCSNANCNGMELKETHITTCHLEPGYNPKSIKCGGALEHCMGDSAEMRNGKLKSSDLVDFVSNDDYSFQVNSFDSHKRKEITIDTQNQTGPPKNFKLLEVPSLKSLELKVTDSMFETKRQRIRLRSESEDYKNCEINESRDAPKNGVVVKKPRDDLSPDLASVRNKLSLQRRSKVSSVKLKKVRSKIANSVSSDSEFSDSECSLSDDVLKEEEVESFTNLTSDAISSLLNDFPILTSSIDNGFGDNLCSLVRPSLFPHVPPYLRFSSYDKAGTKIPVAVQKHLKWRLSTITPVVVRRTIFNSGFRLFRKTNDWIGTWGKHMKSPMFRTLKEFQKMNHFPGSFQLGRKDRLWRNVQRLQAKYGSKEFGFIPKTYVLPQDMKLLRTAWEKNSSQETWIVKPPASARGLGIRVVHRWAQIPKKMPLVVQRYISEPYLINGSKFDLRLYVLITSVDPLRIYLYPDGLVRFASVKYSSELSSLSDRYMHLTNYSINKLSSQYTENKDASACQGHKWTINTLWEYLSKKGIDTAHLWSSMRDLVIKTILSAESSITQLVRTNVNSRYNCYELLGVDVLLDENLKPWVLEVNISPSLHSASPLDIHVKGPLVQTLLNIAQYHIPADKIPLAQHESVMALLGLHQTQTNCTVKTTPRSNPVTPILSTDEIDILSLGRSSPIGSASKYESGDRVQTAKDKSRDGMTESSLCFDRRIYTTALSKKEKMKHAQFLQYEKRDDYLNKILEWLSPDDVRKLLLAEDELQVIGPFERVFPTADTHRYLTFMEPRYYDRLFDAWEHSYSSNRAPGIKLLQLLCEKKYHLIVPSSSKIAKNIPKKNTAKEGEENQSAPSSAPTLTTNNVATIVPEEAPPSLDEIVRYDSSSTSVSTVVASSTLTDSESSTEANPVGTGIIAMVTNHDCCSL